MIAAQIAQNSSPRNQAKASPRRSVHRHEALVGPRRPGVVVRPAGGIVAEQRERAHAAPPPAT